MNQESPAELETLLRDARNGGQDACARLVRLLEDVVMKTALAMTGSVSDAQDVAQEVFLRFFKALDRIDAARGVRAWLRKSTVRVCLDLLKRRKRDQRLEPERLENLPETRASHVDKPPLPELLRRLSERERAAFLLVYLFGYSTAEAGAAMFCSAGTVKTLCFRARAKLRGFLKGDGAHE